MGLGQPYSYGPGPLGTKESVLLDDICQLGLWGWEIIYPQMGHHERLPSPPLLKNLK